MTGRRLVATALFALAGVLACAQAVGLQDAPAESAADYSRGELVDMAAQVLEDEYVFPDMGATLAEHLRSERERYAAIAEPSEFAQAITEDLRRISNDLHLRVLVWTEQLQARVDNRPDAFERSEFAYDRLDGDVGYIRLPSIAGEAGQTVAFFDEALAALGDTEALIIDLRGNRGGDPVTVRYVSSYFFSEPTHLVSTEFRNQQPMERWTTPEIAGSVYDRPLYLLTDGSTYSGAESFAFGMRAAGRALLVGENTGGAGHIGGFAPLGEEFSIFVSTGRTYNPHTGEGWEATGIVPDIAVPAEEAVDAALADLSTR